MPIVRIRFALHGCKNRPFYHIVVASNRSKRDGKHLEQVSKLLYTRVPFHVDATPPQVGCYDPMPNYNNELVVGLNVERIRSVRTGECSLRYVYIRYWLSVGAQPTVAVNKLLGLVRIVSCESILHSFINNYVVYLGWVDSKAPSSVPRSFSP